MVWLVGCAGAPSGPLICMSFEGPFGPSSAFWLLAASVEDWFGLVHGFVGLVGCARAPSGPLICVAFEGPFGPPSVFVQPCSCPCFLSIVFCLPLRACSFGCSFHVPSILDYSTFLFVRSHDRANVRTAQALVVFGSTVLWKSFFIANWLVWCVVQCIRKSPSEMCLLSAPLPGLLFKECFWLVFFVVLVCLVGQVWLVGLVGGYGYSREDVSRVLVILI